MALGIYTDSACTQFVDRLDSLSVHSSGILWQIGALATPITLYAKDDAVGYRTPQAVSIYCVDAHGTAVYDSDITLSSDGSSYVSAQTGVNIGIVTNSGGTAFYVKQGGTGKSSGNTSVYLRGVFGAASIALPAITVGPSVSPNTTDAVITASFNGAVKSCKYIVKTTNVAPSTADWSAATASSALLAGSVDATQYLSTPPSTYTNITASQGLFAFVRAYDADGLFATSSGVGFTTNSAGASTTFSAQPTMTSPTTTGFTVNFNVSNPLGYWRISYNGGTTWTGFTPSGSGPYAYAVTGKTGGTAYSVVVQNTQNSDYSGTSATSNSVSMSTTLAAPTVTAAAGASKITDTWSAVTDAASYNVYYGTSASAPTNPTSGSGGSTPTVTGVTSPYDITGLTPFTAEHSWVQSVSATGYLSPWSSDASATPYLVNDFSAGQSLDTTNLAAYGAGSGTYAVASNKLTLDSSAGASSGAVLQYKAQVAKDVHTYELKVTPQTLATGNSMCAITLEANATIPTTVQGSGVRPPQRVMMTFDNVAGVYQAGIQYVGGTGSTYYHHDRSTNTMTSTGMVPATFTLGTTYIVRLETTSTQFRFTVLDASGNPITTWNASGIITPWINWSSVYNDASNTYWAMAGDPYTDYWAGKLEVLYAKLV
ncbi:MAG: hypothetical protein P4L93_11695 [Coriobacteriia bacterium]|nr:hypothetical protein [Coriobacteriia bacterium]